jgi:AcrR family transcriptional regulator
MNELKKIQKLDNRAPEGYLYSDRSVATHKSLQFRENIMPLKTFDNLPETRRREIIDACLGEFVRHGYREASLSRIIRRLGLAKGSFYRYFENKRSLYRYLVDYARSSTMDILEHAFRDDPGDILDAWADFYLACVRQDYAYPLLAYFGYRLSLDKNNPELGDVPVATLRRGTALLRDLFLRRQREGRIRADMEVEPLIFALLQIQSGFPEYLAARYGFDFEANIREGKPLFPLPEDILKQELAVFVRILREGFLPAAKTAAQGVRRDE